MSYAKELEDVCADIVNKVAASYDSEEEEYPPESEIDNIEYKRHILNTTSERFHTLQSQIVARMNRGRGEAIYRIGVEDNGSIFGLDDTEYRSSVDNLHLLAESVNAEASNIYEMETREGLKYGAFIIRNSVKYIDLYIATGGNVDAGKSTIISTLASGKLDDGKGTNAKLLMPHKHEKESGNTSSIAYEIVGIRESRIVNDELNATSHSKPEWEDIIKKSTKVITFKDLAGHRPYFKTTLRGINGGHPDYIFMMIDGTNGDLGEPDMDNLTVDNVGDDFTELIRRGRRKKKHIRKNPSNHKSNEDETPMVIEHMKLCWIWSIPMVGIISKIDRQDVDPIMFDKTVEALSKYCSKHMNRKVVELREIGEITPDILEMTLKLEIVPVFRISNKTGQGLDMIKHLLGVLPISRKITDSDEFKFSVEETFHKPGFGTIVSGYVLSAGVKVGDKVKLGPYRNSEYNTTRIRHIENKKIRVNSAEAGQHVCFNIPGIERKPVRRGMTLISKYSEPVSVWRFRAQVTLQKMRSMAVKEKYQTVIYSENIREACQISKIHSYSNLSCIELIKELLSRTVDINIVKSDVIKELLKLEGELKDDILASKALEYGKMRDKVLFKLLQKSALRSLVKGVIIKDQIVDELIANDMKILSNMKQVELTKKFNTENIDDILANNKKKYMNLISNELLKELELRKLDYIVKDKLIALLEKNDHTNKTLRKLIPGDISDVTISMVARPINITKGSRFVWSDTFITGVGHITEILEGKKEEGQKKTGYHRKKFRKHAN